MSPAKTHLRRRRRSGGTWSIALPTSCSTGRASSTADSQRIHGSLSAGRLTIERPQGAWVCRNRCAFGYALTVFLNDLVDQAVLLGLLSRHNEIALHVLLDLFD
jgi:hypothetical protein